MKVAFTFISAILLAITADIKAQTPDGQWSGDIVLGQGKNLPLVLNIGTGSDGKPCCTLDSPMQGAEGIKTEVNVLTADSINITVPDIAATYAGRVTKDVITGHFTQMGMPFKLDLKRGGVMMNRPQTPQPPLGYTTQEVSFENKAAGAVLSGTLTWPEGYDGKKPVPVVIMVSGSGLQNRDEEVFGHKPFLVLADRLARNGIASLRYDDRGTGKSTGDASKATTSDFMKDAAAGLELLRSMDGKFSRVGVIGHSEGGLIAFMLAADGMTDFIVSMAGPGVRGDTIIAGQNNDALMRMGRPANVSAADVRTQAGRSGNAWLEFFTGYDPADVIASTTCPAMVINGTKDTQVRPRLNLDRIRNLLPHNRKNMIREYDGLNHLFQHCTTGYADEYGAIEETMSEEVMKDIAGWINSLDE